MKKITIITMQLKTPGGIERFVSTIATMFSKDYEVEIVANYGRPSDQLAFPIEKNIKTTFLSPLKPAEISLKKIITDFKWHKIPSELSRRLKINRERTKAFKNYLERLKTDFIITDRALYNSLVGKYYHGNAKKIATDHNYHQNNPKYINELARSLKSFDILVVPTDELKKDYQNIIKPTKCYCIPIALDHIPTKKTDLKTKNLLAVGRLVPEKDYLSLIEAMSQIHQKDPLIKLTIIGDGQEMPKIKSKIKSLHLENVVFLPGWLPQSEIEKYYYNSSLFVMTSKTEAFGLALIEAMSYGLPCVALARASGARNLINSENGILITSENPLDLAKQILQIIDDKAKLHSYQKNINQTISSYSIKSIYTLWQNILK